MIFHSSTAVFAVHLRALAVKGHPDHLWAANNAGISADPKSFRDRNSNCWLILMDYDGWIMMVLVDLDYDGWIMMDGL